MIVLLICYKDTHNKRTGILANGTDLWTTSVSLAIVWNYSFHECEIFWNWHYLSMPSVSRVQRVEWANDIEHKKKRYAVGDNGVYLGPIQDLASTNWVKQPRLQFSAFTGLSATFAPSEHKSVSLWLIIQNH